MKVGEKRGKKKRVQGEELMENPRIQTGIQRKNLKGLKKKREAAKKKEASREKLERN